MSEERSSEAPPLAARSPPAAARQGDVLVPAAPFATSLTGMQPPPQAAPRSLCLALVQVDGVELDEVPLACTHRREARGREFGRGGSGEGGKRRERGCGREGGGTRAAWMGKRVGGMRRRRMWLLCGAARGRGSPGGPPAPAHRRRARTAPPAAPSAPATRRQRPAVGRWAAAAEQGRGRCGWSGDQRERAQQLQEASLLPRPGRAGRSMATQTTRLLGFNNPHTKRQAGAAGRRRLPPSAPHTLPATLHALPIDWRCPPIHSPGPLPGSPAAQRGLAPQRPPAPPPGWPPPPPPPPSAAWAPCACTAGGGGWWVGGVVGGGWWWWGGRSLRHAGQWAGTMLWQNQRLPAALARPPHHLVACHAAGDHLVDGGVLVDERKQLGAAVGVKAARRGKAGTALQGMQARGCSSCRAPPSRLQAGHTERPCHMPPHCAGSLNGRVVMLRPLLTAPSKRRPGSSARRRCAPRTAPASPCGPCLQPGGVGGGPQQAAGMNTLHAAGIASNPQTTVHTRSSRRHRSKARPTVACKVDAQHRLRQLWGHLLAGQVHAPVAVGVAVQAQIFAVGPRRCVQLLVVCGKAQEQACDARCEAVKQGRRGVGTGSVRRHRWRAQARARARAAPPFAARRQQPL